MGQYGHLSGVYAREHQLPYKTAAPLRHSGVYEAA